jgi:hypothetical protein
VGGDKMVSTENLLHEIEERKRILISMVSKFGISHPDVLTYSQELDKLIVQAQECIKKGDLKF